MMFGQFIGYYDATRGGYVLEARHEFDEKPGQIQVTYLLTIRDGVMSAVEAERKALFTSAPFGCYRREYMDSVAIAPYSIGFFTSLVQAIEKYDAEYWKRLFNEATASRG